MAATESFQICLRDGPLGCSAARTGTAVGRALSMVVGEGQRRAGVKAGYIVGEHMPPPAAAHARYHGQGRVSIEHVKRDSSLPHRVSGPARQHSSRDSHASPAVPHGDHVCARKAACRPARQRQQHHRQPMPSMRRLDQSCRRLTRPT
jgi:hypothetical protein